MKAFENLMSTVNVVSLDTWLGMNLAGNFTRFSKNVFYYYRNTKIVKI